MDSVSSAARSAGEYVKNRTDLDTADITRVREKLKDALDSAKNAVSETAAQLKDQASQMGRRTDTYVRDNPWQVIGVAALVGLAVGFLASRRSN
jgi:ElaB/YqjD/DUF883 family membrane-anchored ribosome-binding protein